MRLGRGVVTANWRVGVDVRVRHAQPIPGSQGGQCARAAGFEVVHAPRLQATTSAWGGAEAGAYGAGQSGTLPPAVCSAVVGCQLTSPVCAAQHLGRIATATGRNAVSPLASITIVDKGDATGVLRRFGASNLTPWLGTHRHELNRTLRCQPHEMFDHPVAIMLVADSRHSDPMACFQELASRHHFPAVFHNVRCCSAPRPPPPSPASLTLPH